MFDGFRIETILQMQWSLDSFLSIRWWYWLI